MESGLRVMHNVSAWYAHRQVSMTNSKLNKSLEKLSSGYRINRAADDAAGLAISEKMRMEINGLDQAAKNTQDGISLIQTAEAGLDELHNILQRMRILAIQSSNDTLTISDRRFIQYEIDQLLSEIDRMQTTVQFNTKKLLTGAYITPPSAGGPGSLNFHVGGQQNQVISVQISSFSTTGLGIDTMKLSTRTASNGMSGNTLCTRLGAESSIGLLTSAINEVSRQRAELGAKQNRLEHTYNFILISKENQQNAESRIRDVDMAAEMVKYTKNQILLQAGQAMLSQANMRPQSVLQMFQ